MLPNGAIVKAVYAGDVLGHAPASALLLDCSTIDVATAREVGALAEAGGYRMVDAPVSGGIAAAMRARSPSWWGRRGGFRRSQPDPCRHGQGGDPRGGSGAGQAAKICNNMLLGASMVATCETFRLAERLGLDLQTFDIASKASGQCWSMTSYCPVPGVGPQTRPTTIIRAALPPR
jgi:3-hydroxyisobutyrate dehydrogenase